MKILDCSSIQSTITSLANLYEISEEQLLVRLKTFSFKKVLLFEDELIEWISTEKDSTALIPDAIIWFHTTRIRREINFKATGLKPLYQCLPEIKQFIIQIVDKFGGYSPGGSEGFMMSYCSKIKSLESQGPYAFSIRDAAFRSGRNRCTFQDAPEIVKDLAQIHGGANEKLILEEYFLNTSPCIVKFINHSSRPDTVRYAAAYTYAFIHNEDDPASFHTCFDGQGHAIPPNEILDVEWL